MDNNFISLVKKYNRPIPRYTSYPTVPFWDEQIPLDSWEKTIQNQFEEQNSTSGLSIYLHLPFCESLCTYCGCNKKITTNHFVEDTYIDALQKEWNLYRRLMKEPPVIRELHLGGGTPTFFSPQNLERIVNIFLSGSIVHASRQFSIEAHPNNTTRQQLQVMYNLGFRRISYGVQDNNEQVQRVINRIQPFENVVAATQMAREIGFTSVNFDLIYGLPLQTPGSITQTIYEVAALRPDRIAFYSYAHVPWTSKAQRLFNENDLPANDDKIALYLKGKEILLQQGYFDIGMDHFALPHDELVEARNRGTLHRNFMGYTTQHAGMLIGLGVSAISDAGIAYAQNEKTLHDYYAAIDQGRLPVKKGYFLTMQDQLFKRHIINMSCIGKTLFQAKEMPLLEEYCFPVLEELAADGLVEYDRRHCAITEAGHYFIRNICSAFDLKLQRTSKADNKKVFSMSV